MKFAHRLLSAAALALLSTSTLATTITHTSTAAFLSKLAPGAYLETFNSYLGQPDPPAGPMSFSGNGFSYTAFASSNLYTAGGFLGASDIDDALTITFTSGNVRAVGGFFANTDINDDPLPPVVPNVVKVTLNDGTSVSFTPTNLSELFRGFVSDVAITSLVISAPGDQLYASVENLMVGTVPEPAGWMLVGLALAGLAASRRRAD